MYAFAMVCLVGCQVSQLKCFVLRWVTGESVNGDASVVQIIDLRRGGFALNVKGGWGWAANQRGAGLETVRCAKLVITSCYTNN